MILLNSDPTGELLTEEGKEQLIQSINKKFTMLIDYINNNEKIEEEVFTTLEILLDVSCYINNDETILLIKKIKKLNINSDCKVFLIKTEAINNLNINKEILIDMINNDYSFKLLQILERINKSNILPQNILTQEKIAKSLLIDWLKYPTELGENPEKIEYVDCLEEDNIIYYIYKFTAREGALKDRGYMIGISGGFEKDKITSENTGFTFSKFQTINENYKKQAEEIIELISEHWKNYKND